MMNEFGYFGIFLLIAIENIFPPIPSELILAFGGFMTAHSKLNIALVILFATLGSLVGGIVLYYVGKILNKERLKKIVSGKIGKILRLKEEDIEKADKWFDNKGNKTVFFLQIYSNSKKLNFYTCRYVRNEYFKIFTLYLFRFINLEYCTSIFRKFTW